jgi:hypothetical protein
VGGGRSTRKQSVEIDLPEEKRAFAGLWFEGELRKNLVLGEIICWQNF